MSFDISEMICINSKFIRVLKRIIRDNSCDNVNCWDCPFDYKNHIHRIGCSSNGGFNDGAEDIDSPIIINNAKFLLKYLHQDSIDINKI